MSTLQDIGTELKREILIKAAKEAEMWTMEDFVAYGDLLVKNGKSPIKDFCPHGLMAIRLLDELEAERNRNEILLQRMEDLCCEMEEIKAKAENRVFVLGPGTENADD